MPVSNTDREPEASAGAAGVKYIIYVIFCFEIYGETAMTDTAITSNTSDLEPELFASPKIVHWTAAGTDHDLWLELGARAVEALKEEDASIREKLREGAAGAQYAGTPAGLTYWLFETTLVYLIFKAWAPRRYVEWDWVGSTNRATGLRNPIDLVVEVAANGREFGIEAKWWSTRRVGLAMDLDANKLLEWMGEKRANRSGFLLGFWWTKAEHLAGDQADARAWRQHRSRPLVYRASFLTLGPGKEQRRFFLDFMALPEPSDIDVTATTRHGRSDAQ